MDRSRLEIHRDSFHSMPVPMTGPLLRFSELTPSEVSLVNVDLFKSGQVEEFTGIFHDWGVMCPHPMDFAEYEGFYRSDSRLSFEESNWFHCGLCDCIVINR